MNVIQERDTTTIRQTVTFNASPHDVYEMIMDSKKHESLSGEKASISREVGGVVQGVGRAYFRVPTRSENCPGLASPDWWADHYSIATAAPVAAGTVA